MLRLLTELLSEPRPCRPGVRGSTRSAAFPLRLLAQAAGHANRASPLMFSSNARALTPGLSLSRARSLALYCAIVRLRDPLTLRPELWLQTSQRFKAKVKREDRGRRSFPAGAALSPQRDEVQSSDSRPATVETCTLPGLCAGVSEAAAQR